MATFEEIRDSLYNSFRMHMLSVNPSPTTGTENNINSFSLAFATAIANNIEAGSSGIPVGDFIKKTGGVDGVMSGAFTANNGFQAGTGNTVRFRATSSGLEVVNDLSILGGVISSGSKNIINGSGSELNINPNSHYSKTNILGDLNIGGSLQLGSTNTSSLFVDDSVIRYKGNNLYHAGNANKSTIDWASNNMTISGTLGVSGITTLNAKLNALNGLSGGFNGENRIETDTSGIKVTGRVLLGSNDGIQTSLNNDYILKANANGDINLNASSLTNGDIILGAENTNRVILSRGLYNFNGDREVIRRFGDGNFRWGFVAGFNGNNMFEMNSQGIQVTGRIWINNQNTQIYEGGANSVRIQTDNGRVDIGPQNSSFCHFSTDRPNFYFNKPLSSETEVRIHSSQTRLANGLVYLSDNNYLQNVTGGVEHFGTIFVNSNIRSKSFSSGFSGNGFEIDSNANATFNNLTIRGRLGASEFEVQKVTAINGTIYVSASCNADTVRKL